MNGFHSHLREEIPTLTEGSEERRGREKPSEDERLMAKRRAGRKIVYREKEVRRLCFTSCLPGETCSRSQRAIFTGDAENENGDVRLGKCRVTH